MSTYVPIQAITLSAATASATFTGIPQTYTDLVVVISGTVSIADNVTMRFNGDSGSNYSWTYMAGTGSSAISGRGSNQTSILTAGFGTTTIANAIWQIQNYSNSTTNKTVLNRGNRSDDGVIAFVGLWRNTAAITSITVGGGAGNLNSGMTLTLYGVGSGTTKASGGEIYVSSGYNYHVFKQSGIFRPSTTITNAEVLIVAGGGGGADDWGGGGGAGGVTALTSQTLTTQNYSVVIGAGGSGTNNPTQQGGDGTNSLFSSTIAFGGGGGGGDNYVGPNNVATDAGRSGGSGGGGAIDGVGGSGTSGQGFSGATGNRNNSLMGGGGGGASQAGQGQAGGNGTSTYSAWGLATNTGQNSSGTVYYAGGGGGARNGSTGAGGLGGGGTGANGATGGTAGTTNTGGGGGASNSNGLAGGSGIVIVRYAV